MTRPRAAPSLRADAQRNRARLLDVAEQLFAANGLSTSTEEIARQAGVGIGTLFRHFPTKEDLLTAVFVRLLRKLTDEAEARSGSDDPGEALFEFFHHVVDHAPTKNAFAGMLADAGVDVPAATAEAGQDLRRAISTLLREAQDHGTVRPDVRVKDLIGLLAGAARAAEYTGQDRRSRQRVIAVILDGLRPR